MKLVFFWKTSVAVANIAIGIYAEITTAGIRVGGKLSESGN